MMLSFLCSALLIQRAPFLEGSPICKCRSSTQLLGFSHGFIFVLELRWTDRKLLSPVVQGKWPSQGNYSTAFVAGFSTQECLGWPGDHPDRWERTHQCWSRHSASSQSHCRVQVRGGWVHCGGSASSLVWNRFDEIESPWKQNPN